MNRTELFDHIWNRYAAEPEYLWKRNPDTAVFRHASNRKWFAILMDVRADRLGLEGDEVIDILNVKCDPEDVLVLQLADSIMPAYHMNKRNWISIRIEGGVGDGMIFDLIAMSHRLTA